MKDVRPSDFCVTTGVALGQKGLETTGVDYSVNLHMSLNIFKPHHTVRNRFNCGYS